MCVRVGEERERERGERDDRERGREGERGRDERPCRNQISFVQFSKTFCLLSVVFGMQLLW